MNNTYILASSHSIKRVKERFGFNKNNAETLIVHARERGLDAFDFIGNEREYLLKKGSQSTYATVYQNRLFIFSNYGVCITVCNLPNWFGRRQFYNGKEKIRHPKKYEKHYSSMNEDDLLLYV